MAANPPPSHLTEMILLVQHEVQSALDYVETVAASAPTALGAAPSTLTVESLRIRMPVVFEAEEEPEGLDALLAWRKAHPGSGAAPPALHRPGFPTLRRDGSVMHAKLRVSNPPHAGETAGAAVVGEIELRFQRIPREVTATDTEEPRGTAFGPVPEVTGHRFAAAAALLRSEGWSFTVSVMERPGGGPKDGTVVDQQPPAGSVAEASTTTVRLTVAATTPRVLDILGIGRARGERLEKAGIRSVAELARATPHEIAAVSGISERRARELIDRAAQRTELHLAGISPAAADLLLDLAISSLQQLAAADPEDLHHRIVEAREQRSARAREPGETSREDVAAWIEAARCAVGCLR